MPAQIYRNVPNVRPRNDEVDSNEGISHKNYIDSELRYPKSELKMKKCLRFFWMKGHLRKHWHILVP